MPPENNPRPCTHFGCVGTQRFSEMAAQGGKPGWDCSEDRDHFDPEFGIDFSAEGRANRMDAILNDLRLLEEEVATIRDPAKQELLHRHTRLLTARVQAERTHINFPGR